MKVLLIDNFDSFSFNLYDALVRLGAEVHVTRNHVERSCAVARAEASDLVVLSPGPGRPETAGVCLDLCRDLAGRVPILGVCLGHQCLVVAHGGRVEPVAPVHGKARSIDHDGRGPFDGLPSPLTVGRYHSLAATEVPEALHVHARSTDGIVMALAHPEARQLGVQFHPESLLTPRGQTFLARAVDHLAGGGRPSA